MIKVLFCQLDCMNDNQFSRYMSFIPKKVQKEIERFNKATDRKARLLGKLMLLKSLRDDNQAFLIERLDIVENNKPVIEGWYEFNISHSGNFVVFCWSEQPVGIDIEIQTQDIIYQVTNWLHPGEQELLHNAGDHKKLYFDMWTKKEALLKNIGIGLVNNLNEINCVDDQIEYNFQKFYFYPVIFHLGYSAHICSSVVSPGIKVSAFRTEYLNPNFL